MTEPFTAAAARLSGVEERILTEAADRFDVLAKEAASRAVGGGYVMLIHGRRNRRTPVKMGTRSNVSGGSVFVVGSPRGPWVWIESGTKAHRIPKGRRRTFLKAPGYDHPVRSVQHLGATGKRAWTRAEEQFRTEYPDIVVSEVRKAFKRGR